MNVIPYKGETELLTVGFGPGELLLEGIEQAIEEYDIKNGVIVSGIGTFKTCRLHHVTSFSLPPHEVHYTIDKPTEFTAMGGVIANGEPHIHLAIGYGQEETYVGHLEHQSEVGYLAEIVILKANGHHLTRRPDASGYLRLLEAAE